MKMLRWKVGGLILFSIALLGGFIALLGNVSLRGGHRFLVDFDFSGNLQSGAAVKISGIKVGKVDDVRFLGGQIDPSSGRRVQVRIVVWVEDRVKDAIRQDAEFFVNTQGVLGEQYLEIQPGSFDKPPLAVGAIVRGVDPPRTDLIVARLYEFLDAVTLLLRDDKEVIRNFLTSGASLLHSFDLLLKDNRGQLSQLIAHVDALTIEGTRTVAALRSGVGDGMVLRQTLQHVDVLAANVARDIEPLLKKTERALDGIGNVTAVVGPHDREKVARLLDSLVATAQKTDRMSGDAEVVVASIRQGKGTAGGFLIDAQVYDDIKEMVRDLKRNPWKFFWKE